MRYYFINTDRKTLKYSPHNVWIDNGLAFTGGTPYYGRLLEQLQPDDICFMYVNKDGVMAVGRVLEEWDGKVYDPPMLYTKPDNEYRIKVDWVVDLRKRPIAVSELHSVIGWQPVQALQPMKSQDGDKLRNYIQEMGLWVEPESQESNVQAQELHGQAELAADFGISSPDEIDDTDVLYEGAKRQISVNAYERNPEARQKCIGHYGASCFVCGFDFAVAYGDVGRGLIHVHHLRQLSDIGEQYVIDLINDLRPVCPNCHAVIHRRKPPYSIEEVKEFLQ